MRKVPLYAFLFGLGALALAWALSTNKPWVDYVTKDRFGLVEFLPFSDLWGFALVGGLLLALGSSILERSYSNWAAWIGVALCSVALAWPWTMFFNPEHRNYAETELWIATVGVAVLAAGALVATVRSRHRNPQ